MNESFENLPQRRLVNHIL